MQLSDFSVSIGLDLDDEIYSFVPTGTTTMDDCIAHVEEMTNAAIQVFQAADDVAGDGETLSIVDMLNACVEAWASSIKDAKGNPLQVKPLGLTYVVGQLVYGEDEEVDKNV